MGNASSIRRAARVTRSCSGGRRMAPAATSCSLTRAKDLLELRAHGWSADGQQLLFTEVPQSARHGRSARDRAPVRRHDAGHRRQLCTDNATVSPDGRWIAYRSVVCRCDRRSTSSSIRSSEIGSRSRRRGGRLPIWSRDGRGAVLRQPGRSADVCRPGAVRDDAGRRAAAAVVRIPDAGHVGSVSAVRPRSRRTIRDDPEW